MLNKKVCSQKQVPAERHFSFLTISPTFSFSLIKLKTLSSFSTFLFIYLFNSSISLPPYAHPSLYFYFYPSFFSNLSSDIFFPLARFPSFLLPSGLGTSVPAFPCGVMPLIPTDDAQLALWSPAIWSPDAPCSCI